jgi:hypothetical protein
MLVETLFADWSFVAVAAVMATTAIYVLVYLFGQFLSDEKIIAYAKLGFADLLYSGFLLVATIFILGIATEAAGGFVLMAHPLGAQICGAEYDLKPDYAAIDSCYIRGAKHYLDTLYTEGKDFSYELLTMSIWFSFFQGIGISSDFHDHASGTISLSPIGGAFTVPLGVYTYMFEFASKALIMIRFQQFFLYFITTALYPVLTILGLILRISPLTRRLGGLLMAIGISLFFVFPMFYVMGGMVLENIRLQQADMNAPVIGTLNFDSEAFYSRLNLAATDQADYEALLNDPNFKYNSQLLQDKVGGLNYCASSTDSDISMLQMIADTVKTLIYSIDFTGLIISNDAYLDSLVGPGGVIDATARLVFFSMFFTLLSVFATVGAIKGLSPLLGGDTEIAGLTHLI